ncbi:hypothetical protein [Candidatus Frankia nodulisporulans]|uniref:hypothetical protein n=1 Tax=Candidatus Frankia nodulisporulans TaxID=2060052 RepID=UPI0013D4F995|nr:hypothetical protein [Candidatus Frankia nodulisporulans]
MATIHDHLRDDHAYTPADFTAAAELGGSLIEEHADDHDAISYLTSRGQADERTTAITERHRRGRRR